MSVGDKTRKFVFINYVDKVSWVLIKEVRTRTPVRDLYVLRRDVNGNQFEIVSSHLINHFCLSSFFFVPIFS